MGNFNTRYAHFNRRPLKFTWELEDREALRGIDAFAEMVALK